MYQQKFMHLIYIWIKYINFCWSICLL